MSKEINLDLLNILIELLPPKIKLLDIWEYEFVGTLRIDITKEVTMTVYQFIWNGGTVCYFSRDLVQEKFNIINLHKKILKKQFRNLSEEEKLYLFRYYRFEEKIND